MIACMTLLMHSFSKHHNEYLRDGVDASLGKLSILQLLLFYANNTVHALVIFCVLYCNHQTVYGISLSYYLCLTQTSVFGFGLTMTSGLLFLLSAEYSITMCGARPAVNFSDIPVASSQYDILLCSETWVADIVSCRSCWFPDLVDLSCCARP